MTDRKTPPTPATAKTRKPWVAPRVAKIDAGQAEVGTRTLSDGSFSTS
jgi:hypothetical protein